VYSFDFLTTLLRQSLNSPSFGLHSLGHILHITPRALSSWYIASLSFGAGFMPSRLKGAMTPAAIASEPCLVNVLRVILLPLTPNDMRMLIDGYKANG
jgi:hypothetical protein